jgi:hypothetical protein
MGFASFLLAVILGASDPPAITRIVAGVAVDGSGKPIAGAAVNWTLGRASGAKLHDVIRTTTDQQGKFLLECPVGYVPQIWSADRNVCWIHHPSHGVATFEPDGAEIAPGESPFFKCTVSGPNETCRVRVVDHERRLLPGALIEAIAVDCSEGLTTVPLHVREALSVVTDENGEAVLPTRTASWSATEFCIASQSHGRQVFGRQAVDEKALRTIQLAEVGRLSGHLVRKDGGNVEGNVIVLTPDENARLAAQIAEARKNEGAIQTVTASPAREEFALTDKDGRFVFEQIPLSVYKVGAVSTRASGSIALPFNSVQVRKDESNELTLTTDPTVTVHGHVNQADVGPPISGVQVYISHVESRQLFSTTPDATGRYSIAVPLGKIRGFLMGSDGITQKPGELASWKDPVALNAGDEGRELPPLTFTREGLSAGRLLSRDRTPMRRKRVLAHDDGIIRGVSKSDNDGRIWFSNKILEGHVSFRVRIEGKYRDAKIVGQSPLELVVDEQP